LEPRQELDHFDATIKKSKLNWQQSHFSLIGWKCHGSQASYCKSLFFGNLIRVADGLFSNQKSKFGYILEGLAMEDDGMFYGHLVHFTVFCCILWTVGISSSW
jgi:hypothetical protein